MIVPTLTYVATANAVRYCGASRSSSTPSSTTWNIDPELADAAVTDGRRDHRGHLYGHPADMDPLLELARRHGMLVARGCRRGARRKVQGPHGRHDRRLSTFSFYGNKIVTTGEGGMVVTDDDDIAAAVRLLKRQGQDPDVATGFPPSASTTE